MLDIFVRYFVHNWNVQTYKFTTYNWLSSALSYPFIVQQVQSNERYWNRMFLFSPSQEIYCDRLYMCAFSYMSFPHACCWWLNWKVFDVFVLCAFSITVILKDFVFVAFAYCFHVNGNNINVFFRDYVWDTMAQLTTASTSTAEAWWLELVDVSGQLGNGIHRALD